MTKKRAAVHAAKKGFKRLTHCLEIASKLSEKEIKWVMKRLNKMANEFEKEALKLAKNHEPEDDLPF